MPALPLQTKFGQPGINRIPRRLGPLSAGATRAWARLIPASSARRVVSAAAALVAELAK
jgi:hypothetical protein